jgi:hypothetical protein
MALIFNKTMKKSTQKKSIKVIVLRIFASIFLLFQLLSYPHMFDGMPDSYLSGSIGYFIGFNLFLYVSAGLFYWAWKVKKKNQKFQNIESIDSIGKTDEN